MKILVINLLRIGDFLQAAPVIEGLTRRYAGSRVDVLCFRGTERLAEVTPFVGRWWTLDRDELQSGLGRADLPALISCDVIGEFLDQVSSEEYDLVVNLTHTRFSGLINGYVRARDRIGLEIDPGGRAHFHSPWFEYLNEHAGRPGADVFHQADVFWQACGLKNLDKRFVLGRAPGGGAEVAALKLDARPVIAVQPYTSDERKTYPRARLIKALRTLGAANPDFQTVLLAAPNEAMAASELAAAVGGRVAVTSLGGALAVLDRARVLITGDTSIKHLACFTNARILELSLGPSDHRRTGVFKPGQYILHSTAGCAPCAHSGACTEARQVCADSIDPDLVARVAGHLARGEADRIQALSGPDTARILVTRHLDSGFWFAQDLGPSRAARDSERILALSAWMSWLDHSAASPDVRVARRPPLNRSLT